MRRERVPHARAASGVSRRSVPTISARIQRRPSPRVLRSEERRSISGTV
jgi:hypothetical protein